MRIALLSDELSYGGAERVVEQLALGLRQRGHAVSVVCLRDAGEAGPRLDAAGISVHSLHGGPRDLGLPRRLVRVLRAEHVDIVHSHCSAAACYGLPAARWLRRPIVHTWHGLLLGQRSLYARTALKLMPRFDACTIVAPTLRSMFALASMRRAAVLTPNGLDRPLQPRRLAERRLGELLGDLPRGPRILSCGTLCVEKDPITLLRAFARLRKRWPDATLLMIGAQRGEAYARALRSAQSELKLDDSAVRRLGRVDDAWRLFAAADVFCLTSRTEAAPLVVLEAMSQGVPIVTTAVGGIGTLSRHSSIPPGEFLLANHETTLLAPAGDDAALADALHATLADPESAMKRAAAARRDFAARYTADQMIDRYEEQYTALTRAHPRRYQPMQSALASPSNRPGVVMIGPPASTVGGMRTVMDALLNSPLQDRFTLTPFEVTLQSNGAPAQSTLMRIVRHLGKLRELFTVLRRTRADIVHIHTCSYASLRRNLLDLLLARSLGRKVVLHIHGGRFADYLDNAGMIERRLVRQLLRLAHAVIVLSETWASRLRSRLPGVRLVVVANGIDPDWQTAAFRAENVRPPRRRATKTCRLLHLGPLTTAKGVEDLLAAAKRLAADGRRFSLRLVGPASDADRQALQARIEAAGLECKVTLHPTTTGAAKALLFHEADAFVLASHSEALPMVLLEAAACELPIVATTVGAVPELLGPALEAVERLQPGPAVLIPPRDPDKLADALRRLIDNAALRRTLGSALRAHICEHYSLERQSASVADLYRSVLGVVNHEERATTASFPAPRVVSATSGTASRAPRARSLRRSGLKLEAPR